MNDAGAVSERVNEVRERISALGADPRAIKVVAVTKGFGPEAIETALAAGFTSVGENYAQEAVAKHKALGESAGRPEWHFIGQLQRNKIRMLAPFIDVWQTVDNVSLIDELARRVPNASIFIQVNLTDDPNRGGCEWGDLDRLSAAARSANLNLLGLMGVAPQGAQSEVRSSFRRLSDESARLGCKEVSMGMSGDFEIAVEEGSTLIRLGSSLFGQRPTK